MEEKQLDIFDLAFPEETKSEQKVETEEVKVSYEDFDYDTLNVYAGIDCIATTELLRKQFPLISKSEPIVDLDLKGNEFKSQAPAIIESFSTLTIPAQEFLIDMELNGIRYSTPRNAWISQKMVEHVARLDEKIFSAIGKEVDLNSGAKIAEFLYGEKGYTPPTFTKSGDPATDGAAIMTLAGLDPVAGKYVTKDPALQWLADMAVRRDVSSSHNTFIKTYVRDFVKRDGRIHPSYNQFGTSSFRITGSYPNLTQLPRNKHGYNIRTCYTVDGNYVFITFDFSSAEMKVLGNLSGDPAMLKAIADGLDFHSFTASAMAKIPYKDFIEVLSNPEDKNYKNYKLKRQWAKVVSFSIIFGSTAAGIASQLFIEKEAAQELMDMYFKAFPKIKDFIDKAHNFALLNQMSITALGQRRRQFGTYQCFQPTAAYNGSKRGSQNFLVQSATSSIGMATFAKLNERIKPLGARSICTVNVGGFIQ